MSSRPVWWDPSKMTLVPISLDGELILIPIVSPKLGVTYTQLGANAKPVRTLTSIPRLAVAAMPTTDLVHTSRFVEDKRILITTISTRLGVTDEGSRVH